MHPRASAYAAAWCTPSWWTGDSVSAACQAPASIVSTPDVPKEPTFYMRPYKLPLVHAVLVVLELSVRFRTVPKADKMCRDVVSTPKKDFQSDGKSFKITFLTGAGDPAVIDCPDDTYILDAAESNGLDLPATCRGSPCHLNNRPLCYEFSSRATSAPLSLSA